MFTRVPRALLVGENPEGSSYLANRLQDRGFQCEFASSSQEAASLIRTHGFDLVLSPMRLRNISLLPLIDLFDGSSVTLFYFHAVEEGCWWLPAVRRGERCFGSSALRPNEFVSALEAAMNEARLDRPMLDETRSAPPEKPSSLDTPRRREKVSTL